MSIYTFIKKLVKAATATAMVMLFSLAVPYWGFCGQESSGQFQRRILLTYPTDAAPWAFHDSSGQPRGALVDLWRLWSVKTGVEVDFVTGTYAETLEKIRSGAADGLAGTARTSELDQYYSFSRPLMPARISVFVSNKYQADSLVQLKGLDVGVLKGSLAEELLDKNYAFIQLRRFNTNQDMFKAMVMGNVPAFVSEETMARYYLTQSGLLGDYSVLKDLQDTYYHAAAPKERPEVIEMLKDGLSRITTDEIREILVTWDLPVPQARFSLPGRYTYYGAVAAGGLAVLFILLLKLAIARKTGKLKSEMELLRYRNDLLHRELAEKRRAEEESRYREDHYRGLADNSLEMIGSIDKSGIVTYANKSLLSYLGYRHWDVTGKHCRRFLAVDGLKRVEGFFNVLSYEEPETGPCRIRALNRDHLLVPLDVLATPMYQDSQIIGVLFIARPAAKDSKSQETMEAMRDALEDSFSGETPLL